ncbi:MAG: hypothetical protein QOF04_655 [Solirubrobacteraceae bacterium]|jgi:hypothetical protein|nr:hypothetical protein [Solirubrobacteraceae bacterium]
MTRAPIAGRWLEVPAPDPPMPDPEPPFPEPPAPDPTPLPI